MRWNNFRIPLLMLLILLVVVAIRGITQQAAPSLEYSAESIAAPEVSLASKEETDSSVQVVTPASKEEVIGVWVPYMTLKTEDGTKEAFCANFDQIAKEAAEMGINALFIHVRPFGDALYPSDLYPWSHILTGVQGTDPGFDPLRYMIDKTHAEGMAFHAWINPLRVSLNSVPPSFSADNPYLAWQADADKKDVFILYENGILYDPGYAVVRDHIVAGVAEIVENYEVDGIHFDDYFYPQNEPDVDSDSYAAYLAGIGAQETVLNREEWRVANINALVSQVYATIKSIDPSVVFGISPTGVVANNASLSADVISWCTVAGYVDYICPQLYYSTEGGAVPFDEALAAWLDIPRLDSVDLYIGLAAYKAGTDADNGAWMDKNDILMQEVLLGREHGAVGFLFYAWDQLKIPEAAEEVQNAFALLKGRK